MRIRFNLKFLGILITFSAAFILVILLAEGILFESPEALIGPLLVGALGVLLLRKIRKGS